MGQLDKDGILTLRLENGVSLENGVRSLFLRDLR
jgi:hypothetical protein